MAPPLAADNFGQRQPITTAIKGYCQYYPPNTCLRELLQNADDAGATEIEYVLDTKSYGGEPLLSNGLKDYQGPALLARNNSVFRDEDFNSLSTVGDSVKVKDPASTGKFGQGFNAVYHWTDGPWVYSRNWLLILDPHEWWSRETGQAGGPRWDVVMHRDSVEIQNHLKTFREFGLDRDQALSQTVIRIPLRTAAQAARSKLFQLKVDTREIRQALQEFCQEMKEGGLLFLKHIRKVIVRVNSDVMIDAEILEDLQGGAKIRQLLPAQFKDLYANVPPRISADVYRFFELSIRYMEGNTPKVYDYAIQHLMLRSSGDAHMDTWARQQKLFPWVAIAAQLNGHSGGKSVSGRLFTTLRLPMLTNLPLHVHGLFSIAPDRGRLSFTRGSDDLPTKWNTFMFTRCVASAWLKLLDHRSKVPCHKELFAFWPKANFDPVEMWDRLDDSIIDLAITHNSQVWNVCSKRCVAFKDALFGIKNAETATYGSALVEARTPAVYPDEPLFKKLVKRSEVHSKDVQILSPTLVRRFLRSEGLSASLSDEVASRILEFCILDAVNSKLEGSSRNGLYRDLHDISLWPMLSGKRTAPDSKNPLLLPRDSVEMRLFAKSRASSTLNTSKLRPSVQKLLLKDIEHLAVIMRHRDLDDLAQDWPVMYPIALDHRSENWVLRPPNLESLLCDIWAWIFERIREGQRMSPTHSGSLWLVPVNGGRVRKYQECKGHPILLIEKQEPLFPVLTELASHQLQGELPIFDTAVFTSEAVKSFRNDGRMRSDMNCAGVDQLDTFVDWLVVGKKILAQSSEHAKETLLGHLEKLTRDYRGTSSMLRTQIRQLPLYSKVSCVPPFRKYGYIRCSLDGSNHLYAAPAELPPLPDLPQASFFCPQSSAERLVVERLNLLECVSNSDLLTRHFLHWMGTVPTSVGKNFSFVKEALADWLTKKSPIPRSKVWQADIFSHAVIPLPVLDEQRHYGCLDEMIDPSSKLARLYDAEERRFPCSDFFARHKNTLTTYGILSKPAWFTPIERAKYLSQRHDDIDTGKIQSLLELPVLPEFANSDAAISEIRSLKWLPGTSAEGQSVLLAPNECRGADQSYLVDMVLGTTTLSVNPKWKNVLGWNEPIESTILLQQLDGCLSAERYLNANEILHHIRSEDCSALVSRACILGRSGNHLPPTKVFLPGSRLSLRSLVPYLDEVDGKFARDHEKLLSALGVQPQPSIKDLREVQNRLEMVDGRLSSAGVGIAISVLEIATSLGLDLVDLLVPDTLCKLRGPADIVQGESLDIDDKAGFNFTHPDISAGLAHRLGIETVTDRAIRLGMDLENDDDGETYTPSESLVTNIGDTLERYSIADTFNEFLANADDAGATRITWILDECTVKPHKSSSLLTTKLQPFQGPALLVHNDGIFSMKDFNGFKDIGKGGKKGDPTSTGMFGRGALTMYHFTDVPMLISNESFVVLDPQQQILPVDRTRRKRRVGMRMPLSKVNRLAPDQLDPFVGLQGFNRDADKYHGTLFRFPLRALGAKTTLKETDYGMDMASVRSLLTEFLATARTALLFLQHVKSIEFHIRGQQNPQWGVSARCFPDTVNDTFRRTEITTSQIGSNQHLDIWCVGLETITQMTPSTARSGRGSGKMTECGVAACLVEGQLRKAKREEPVPSSYQPKSTVSKLAQQPAIQQKVFCRLPTTHKSSLPVSFHASFAVTGDRRSISLEASAENSEWNRWLLKDRTAELYLDTVQYLAPRLGQDAFNFWPVYGETTTLSNILARAFWERLVDQHRPALLPLVTRDNRPKKNTGAALFGLTEKATSLAAGTLDLLPTPTSEGLLPLLTQTVPLLALVRPPAKLRLLFRTPPLVRQIQELDVECLSSVFRAEENCKLLELLMASSEDEKEQVGMVRSLLKTMIPVARGEDTAALELLDRCRIVPRPRLGDRMGTLIWKPSPGATEHLVATLKEQELFAFGADSMVNTSLFTRRSDALAIDIVDHDPVKILLNFGFNLRPLELSDLGPLLARPDSPTATAAVNYSQNLDIWLPEFWRYLNIHLYAIHNLVDYSVTCSDKAIHTLLSKYGLQDKYIYRKYADQRWVYLTPSEFEAGACLMQPVDERHRQICGEIPGLSMIDHNCAPYFLKEQERDLNCGKSFKRLLLAVEKLEKSRKAVAKTFMGLALTSKSKDLMKDLALDYLNSFDFEGLNDNAVLGRLPVWRRLESSTSSPNDHIAAEDGRFCAFRKMLMPWVQDLSRFVVPEMVDSLGSALSRLGISPMTHQQIWDEIKGDLPSVIKSNEFRQYSDFIDFIARWDIKVSGKLAPNGASVMCITNCLYDDQDEIFKAAFRQQQPTRFLHPEMRKPALRKFWLEQGLRVRSSGVMVEEHFLECALAINRRWDPGFTTPNFEEDSKTVAAYLKYDNRHFRSWFSHNWLRLASIPMFKVRNIAAEESNHRVTRMQQIAQERTHRALEESSNMNHKRIVWSQTAFLQEQPGEFVYDVLPRGGKPTAVQVFDHLGFLVASIKDVEQADLPEYLRDVQDCYEFLQDEIGATKHIPGIQRARIWLNLDSTQVEKAYKDHLEINLTSADVLCLNSPVVSLPLQRVRKFLVPYEKLLQGLGSQTIVQPSSTSEPQSSDSRELSLATAMSKMRGLRDQNQLVDVYFEAAGQKAPAHKIVLAAVSEYCEKQFAGHWGRVLESQATVHVEDLRFLTLSQMIDFAYTGDFEWPELKHQDDATEVEETLAMLLDLLDGTDRWLLQRLHDMTDNFLTSQPDSSFYIRVDTVEWAKERAEGSRASKLVKYCEEFLTDNEGPMEAWRRGVEAEG